MRRCWQDYSYAKPDRHAGTDRYAAVDYLDQVERPPLGATYFKVGRANIWTDKKKYVDDWVQLGGQHTSGPG